MSLLETTKLLLRKHRIFPNRRLGQNFTIEPSIFQHMVEHSSLCRNDEVLDVGAGFGFLTRVLASECKRVIAVEADAKLAEILQEQLGQSSNVQIIRGNVLKVKIPHFNKVVSIPPYQISSHLLEWLFLKDFDGAVMIFQREFADRLVASAGSRNYGWLAVATCYYAEVELLDAIPSCMFYPRPEVDSLIVRLKPKRQPPLSSEEKPLFVQLVQSLFRSRNRKVRNAVLPFLRGIRSLPVEDAKSVADELPYRDKRVRELAPEDFGVLLNAALQ